jgi:hypothetical protein
MSGWPELVYEEWKDSLATLHLWTQIVGKVRLARSPWVNHSWHVPFYVTARGLTTSPIPDGARMFEIEFDFLGHELVISTTDGRLERIQLGPRTVADFYQELFGRLKHMALETKIRTVPNEIPNCIPFDKDQVHAAYDREYVTRFWHALIQADRVLKAFRSRFIGKSSPVHFFWGGFDMAATRFSGRRAPPHPGGIPNLPDWVTREAYSHEVSSCGFWPGGDPLPEAVFYAYAYPEPAGFKSAEVRPVSAYYHADLGEFILPYAKVREAGLPDAMLLEFLQSSYEAAADLGGWDRPALERAEAALQRQV